MQFSQRGEITMKLNYYISILAAIWWFASGISVVSAVEDDRFVNDPRDIGEINQQISKATISLQKIAGKIPQQLLQQSKGIVIAEVKNGGFILVFQAGQGVLFLRNGQWSNPALITVSSASFGFQAGVVAKKIVLVFTKRETAEAIVTGQLKLGVELDAAVGPLNADKSTHAIFDKEIYSYAEGIGLFAGISLKGSTLAIDVPGNQGLYGPKYQTEVNAKTKTGGAYDILLGKLPTDSATVRQLKELLERITH
jgi:lipid-binding SYLF domain-containing protein